MGERGSVKRRWWVPVAAIPVYGGIALWFHLKEDAIRWWVTVGVFVAWLVHVLVWFLFFTGKSRRQVLAYLCVVGLLIMGGGLGFGYLARIEGRVGGSGLPRLVSRSAPAPDDGLRGIVPEPRVAAALGSVLLNEEEGGSFSQFLGPERDGVVRGVELEADWERFPPEEVWRQRIGVGWSGFAVEGARAVTQEQRGEMELVSCYELSTGAMLWSSGEERRFTGGNVGDGPRATPTIFQGKVYSMGPTGVLDCRLLEDGAVLWSRKVLEESAGANLMYGISCSPLVIPGEPTTAPGMGGRDLDGIVVVTGGDKGKPTILACNRHTGELVWEAGDDGASYASPVLARLGGEKQVVNVSANAVTGHEPFSGKILWKHEWPARWPKSTQPQIIGERHVFVTASYGLGGMLLEVSRRARAEEFKVFEVWKSTRMKTKFSNVCIRDGYGYGLDEGRLACIDLATGERKWKGAKYGYGQNLLVGKHLLVQAEKGYVALVEANPEEFVEVAQLEALGSKTWNNPALAGEYLLLRNDREAVCYRLALKRNADGRE